MRAPWVGISSASTSSAPAPGGFSWRSWRARVPPSGCRLPSRCSPPRSANTPSRRCITSTPTASTTFRPMSRRGTGWSTSRRWCWRARCYSNAMAPRSPESRSSSARPGRCGAWSSPSAWTPAVRRSSASSARSCSWAARRASMSAPSSSRAIWSWSAPTGVPGRGPCTGLPGAACRRPIPRAGSPPVIVSSICWPCSSHPMSCVPSSGCGQKPSIKPPPVRRMLPVRVTPEADPRRPSEPHPPV